MNSTGVYHSRSMKCLRTLAIESPVIGLTFTNDGERLVSVSEDPAGGYTLIYWKWLKQQQVS